MHPRTLAALTVTLLVTCTPSPSGAENQILTHLNIGYGRSIEAKASGGSVALAIGLIFRQNESPFGFGADVGYTNLGSMTHMTGISYSGPITEKKRWFCSHITAQGYLFASGRDRVVLYPTIGLGYYDLHGADRDALEYSDRIPPPGKSEGAFGGNVGFGWMSNQLDKSPIFGFDLKLHSLWTEGESTELVTAHLRVCFH